MRLVFSITSKQITMVLVNGMKGSTELSRPPFEITLCKFVSPSLNLDTVDQDDRAGTIFPALARKERFSNINSKAKI